MFPPVIMTHRIPPQLCKIAAFRVIVVQVLSNKQQGMRYRKLQRQIFFREAGRKEEVRVDIQMENYHTKSRPHLL